MSSDLIAEARAWHRPGIVYCPYCGDEPHDETCIVIGLASALEQAEQRAERAEAERDEARADNAAQTALLDRMEITVQQGREGPVRWYMQMSVPYVSSRAIVAVLNANHPGAPLLAELERLRAVAEAARRFTEFFAFLEAGNELDGGSPYPDHAPVVSYMGNGASDAITVGHFRWLRDALEARDD